MRAQEEQFWRDNCPVLQGVLWDTAITLIADFCSLGYLIKTCICFEDIHGRRARWTYIEEEELEEFSVVGDLYETDDEDDSAMVPFWCMELHLIPGVPFQVFNKVLETFPRGALHMPGMIVRGGACFDYSEHSTVELCLMLDEDDAISLS
jgi:hypothetical protein